MARTQPTLVSYSDEPIPVGGTAELDSNYPVTVVSIGRPYDDDDPGRVTVQYSWGATENVEPARLGAYIRI